MVRIRKFQSGDQKQIVQLSKDVFPRFEFNLNHWEWRHKYDKSRIIVAEADEKIIGHWAYVKRDLQQGEKRFKAGLTMAAMTHPRWQNKGIFSKIAKMLFEFAKIEDLDFLFGFPNDASLTIHHHLGFIKIKSFHIFKKRLPKRDTIYKQSILDPVKDYMKIHVPATPNSGRSVHLIKDKRYLRWRYFEKPKSNYLVFNILNKDHARGFLVLKKFPREDGVHLHLIDISVDNNISGNSIYSNLFFSLESIGIQNDTDYLSVWKQNTGSFEDGLIEKFGFINDPSKTFHLTTKGITVKTSSLASFQWDIKMGDTEIF